MAALLLKLGASPAPQQFPRLTGPYLGKAPPGDELTPFAPGIVYLDHGTVSVSPDGQEMYWPTGTAIMMIRIQDGRWTKPAFAPFSGPSDVMFHDDVPFVTPDNKRLFFTSKRAARPRNPGEGEHLVRRADAGGLVRAAAGRPGRQRHGPALAGVGLECGDPVLRRAEREGQLRQQRHLLLPAGGWRVHRRPSTSGPAVNTKDGESQPFVAPDESFILFYRAAGQIPSAYASFKGPDGRWLPAVAFDLPWVGAGLIVSPDGKYLFAGGQWKSAKFIDELKRGIGRR